MTGLLKVMRLCIVMLGCGVYCAWLLKVNINYGDVRFLNCLNEAVRCGRTAEYRCCVLRPGCKEYSIELRSQSRPDLQFII